MDSWIWCLPPMVSFLPETSPVNPVADLNKLGVLLEMAAIRDHVVSTFTHSAVCSAAYEGRACLLALIRRHQSYLTHYLYSKRC